MKNIFYTIALVVVIATSSYAQQVPVTAPKVSVPVNILTKEQKAEQTAADYQQKLALTADQKQKIKQLELDRLTKIEDWQKKDQEENKAMMEARNAKMTERQAFNVANKTSLNQVFTADQLKKLTELNEAKRKEDIAKRQEEMNKMQEEMKKQREAKGLPAIQTTAPVLPIKKG